MSDKENKSSTPDSISAQQVYNRLVASAKKAGISGNERTSSLMDSVMSSYDKLMNIGSKSVALKDHYGNSLAAIGNDDKVEMFTNYDFTNDTMFYYIWLALYNDSWVFRRIIDKPAQDQVNCGFMINGDGDYAKVYQAYNRNKQEFTELLQWGALFGGSVGVMMFDGISDEDLAKPIRKEAIKGKRFKIYVTDRWYGVSVDETYGTVKNMRDIDFGKPYMYNITFADGKQYKVHHSYIIRYEHRNAPRLIKNGQLQGWGYAEGAHLLNELSRDDQLKTSITSLVNKALIEVVKMSGMRGVFMGTDKGNEEQLRMRLEMVNWGRTYNSLTFLDKDDEYQQYQLTATSGLADLLEKNMWIVAAAADMQGILFGDLKGGLSQESDALRRYALNIKNKCDSYFRPALTKFLALMYIVYDIQEPLDFEFISMVRDENNLNKINGVQTLASMLTGLLNTKIISKYQMATSIKTFMEKEIVSLQFTEEELNVLKLEEQEQILKAMKQLSSKGVEINTSGFGVGEEPSIPPMQMGSSEITEEEQERLPIEEKTTNEGAQNEEQEEAV